MGPTGAFLRYLETRRRKWKRRDRYLLGLGEALSLRFLQQLLSRHGLQDFAYLSGKLVRPKGFFDKIGPGSEDAKIDDGVFGVG